MKKRLTRSRRNRVIAGVCGGIAEYFEVDPSIIRIGAVILLLIWPEAFLLYLVLAIFLPNEPANPDVIDAKDVEKRSNASLWFGVLLIIWGVSLIFNVSWSIWDEVQPYLWPTAIILVGLWLLWKRR